jgi:methylated-DNA-protein-cysteine methyltransferase-like protein
VNTGATEGHDHPPSGQAQATSPFAAAVIDVLTRLEPGEVVTYGEVAAQAGRPGAARAVGHILKRSHGLPWWRVVTASGRLVPGAERRQADLLRAEGVPVAGDCVKRGFH